MSSLKSKLKKQSTATGSGVAKAFLRAQAALFGSYRDALRYKPVRSSSTATLAVMLCRVWNVCFESVWNRRGGSPSLVEGWASFTVQSTGKVLFVLLSQFGEKQ